MEKRMILALALSFLVVMAFQLFVFKKPPETRPQKITGAYKKIDPAKPVPFEAETRAREKERPVQENLTVIATDKLNMTFSDAGATLKTVSLKEYKKDGDEEILFDIEDPEDRVFAVYSSELPPPGEQKYELTEGENFIEYLMNVPGKLETTKRFTFGDPSYGTMLRVSIKNLSSERISFSYKMRGPSFLEKVSQVAGRVFLEVNSLIDDKTWKVRSLKGAEERAGNISWIAFKNRYFTAILKPLQKERSVIVSQTKGGQLETAISSEILEIKPGETINEEFLIYAGPLDERKIGLVDGTMQGVIDYGFFGGVSKALLAVLQIFHKGTKNWGVAIICLTVAVNLLLFPLTFKSFSSMQQMKKIQPHMQKLKDLHKDNPQKLNKETMALYKKYNVNPLGGCLPLLLQMPLFIALYQGLIRSIVLKGAAFLWIKDLAEPDNVPIPFTLPVLGNSIHVLPLLMVGFMVVQQKLSQAVSGGAATEEQAAQQKMMMALMPILFGFLFYKMPSGLVLYWLTNTILMTAEQTFISRQTGKA